jgi:hypothetical protein
MGRAIQPDERLPGLWIASVRYAVCAEDRGVGAAQQMNRQCRLQRQTTDGQRASGGREYRAGRCRARERARRQRHGQAARWMDGWITSKGWGAGPPKYEREVQGLGAIPAQPRAAKKRLLLLQP